MFKALFDYFPVIPAVIGLLVFCLLPFEEMKPYNPPQAEMVCR